MGQSIGQVVELASGEQIGGHVVLQPQNLGNLHFDAHGATNIAQEVVTGGIDLVSLLDGSVVEPQNDVAIVAIVREVWAGDGYWLVGIVSENGERASGIKANTLDASQWDERVCNDFLDTIADCVPDVSRGLLLEEVCW